MYTCILNLFILYDIEVCLFYVQERDYLLVLDRQLLDIT